MCKDSLASSSEQGRFLPSLVNIMTWSLFVQNERSLRGVLPNQLVEIWLEDDKAGLVEHNSVKLCLLSSLLRNLAKL